MELARPRNQYPQPNPTKNTATVTRWITELGMSVSAGSQTTRAVRPTSDAPISANRWQTEENLGRAYPGHVPAGSKNTA